MESLWRKQQKGVPLSGKKPPEENRDYDVIVIGAGMAGLLTAYFLKERGKRVLVLEAETIASGQTERTTAKITSQHGIKYSTLIEKIGKKKAALYAKANEEAILEYEKLIGRKKIACEFVRTPSYLYTMKQETVLREEARAADALGIKAEFTTESELPFQPEGILCFHGQAQFSPLAFLRAIASELEIREHTMAEAVYGRRVITENGVFMADDIVVAAHYPFLNIPGFYFLRQHQERSYVLALSGCPKIHGMYYGIDADGISLRQSGDLLLFGGVGHRTGEAKRCGAYDMLLEKAKYYFPECKEEARWSAQDCMPHDGVPLIGRYSVFTPHLYVATGFQKWGMTSSMVAAMLLTDEICGVESPYRRLFSPQRLYVSAGIANLVKDVGMSIKGLARGLFFRPRCPHMGCELEWNPQEKSWDCPCHGSRFDERGRRLDNPSRKDITRW